MIAHYASREDRRDMDKRKLIEYIEENSHEPEAFWPAIVEFVAHWIRHDSLMSGYMDYTTVHADEAEQVAEQWREAMA
jgi:hypothetical protein